MIPMKGPLASMAVVALAAGWAAAADLRVAPVNHARVHHPRPYADEAAVPPDYGGYAYDYRRAADDYSAVVRVHIYGGYFRADRFGGAYLVPARLRPARSDD